MATQRKRQIRDFAILEASSEQPKDKDKDQDAEKLKFSRAAIAKMLGVGQSTLKRWESEETFQRTMIRAGGVFSRIRIVFELYALATAQGREITVDLQKHEDDTKIEWQDRFCRWRGEEDEKQREKEDGIFKTRVKYYESLPDSDIAKQERFWTDRFNYKSAAVKRKIDVKEAVPPIQIRYAIDEILRQLQTPSALNAFFWAVEDKQVTNEKEILEIVIKGARRSKMRTVELIKALEERVPERH